LRDIWRRVTGENPLDKNTGGGLQGKILTVFGRNEVVEHSVSEITKEITILGSVLKKQGGTRVAIYLPNSIEFLIALFACSFYGLSPILIPYNQSHHKVVEQLKATKADALIAQAGSLPLEQVGKAYKGLKQVIWVVEKTSRHVDWTEVPKDVGGQVDISMWHQLVQDHQDVSTSDFPDLKSSELPSLVTIWLDKVGATPQIVEFTQAVS
jgi:acyl-CoA synthetase (AMP-forming)/AMP-acid ligase II